jgi:predicted O-methyltransferase YrrM
MAFDPVRRIKRYTSATLKRALQAEFNQLVTKSEMRTATDNVYRQAECLHELHRVLPELSLPPLRRYAISPDSAVELVKLVERHRPGLVVELGSGASSLVLASALHRFAPHGRLVSVDHDETYGVATQRLLSQHGMPNTEVRIAPLRVTEASATPWYQTDTFADLDGIDLLFIDGPPGSVPNARQPSLQHLLSRMSDECVVAVDDTVRADEAELAAAWSEALPGVLDHRDVEKGLGVVTRASGQ